MDHSETKLTQYLQDALVLEGTLRRTLIAHIAISPQGRHRDLLQEHLKVTTEQEQRLAARMAQLRGNPGLVQGAVGAAKATAALGLTLVKGPMDALRGTDAADVELRNAQDESASEALEIAVYDALEALANRLGDTETAKLAAEHRAQEEEFLTQLRELLPTLAGRVADRDGQSGRGPLSPSGLTDAARALVNGAQTALGRGGSAQPAAAAPAATAKGKEQARKASAKAKAAKASASSGSTPATRAKKNGPATPAGAGATTPKGNAPKPPIPATPPKPAKPAPKPAEPPIAQYDDMTPYELGELLDHLPADKLDAIERYEREHANRDQVLGAIEAFRAAPHG